MKKIHVLAVALILGVAAVLGVAAATRTAGVATNANAGVSDSTIAARAHRLDRVEASLRRALRDRPPALPALQASTPAASAAAPKVVYRRPAPIVLVKHRTNHETETGEHEAEHADGEGGADD